MSDSTFCGHGKRDEKCKICFPTPMGTCCERCALYHVSLDTPPELVSCAKKFCECHKAPPTDNRPEAVLDRILTKVGVVPPTPNTGTEWEREFDEKFGEMIRHRIGHYNLQHYADIGREATKEETVNSFLYADSEVAKLKDFIRETLATQKSQIIAEVEAMREPNQGVSEYYSGFNTALDKVKVKLATFTTAKTK